MPESPLSSISLAASAYHGSDEDAIDARHTRGL